MGQREYLFHFGDILLRRDNYQLDEVTIEATKIRMVAGKDTLVFNASEFQLAQGSMLDGLIRLLPGVQLDGSRIMVNGRFVSSLLVNGEDFFKEDPSVALQNLPGYMVNKVKVYERTPEHSYITGIDSLKEIPFVDFLKQRGFTIIPIKPEDELHYANNFLTIAPRHIMAVGNQSVEFQKAFAEHGVTVEWIPLETLIKGYGAAHCMTQVIKAEPATKSHCKEKGKKRKH